MVCFYRVRAPCDVGCATSVDEDRVVLALVAHAVWQRAAADLAEGHPDRGQFGGGKRRRHPCVRTGGREGTAGRSGEEASVAGAPAQE